MSRTLWIVLGTLAGGAAGFLALFTLRVLGGLVGDLQASRESSMLGADPVAILTAGIGEKPVHRR